VLIRAMDAREPALTDGVSNNADGATAAADPYSHRREAGPRRCCTLGAGSTRMVRSMHARAE